MRIYRCMYIWRVKKWHFVFFLVLGQSCFCQQNMLPSAETIVHFPTDSLHSKNHTHAWLAGAGTLAGYGGSFIFLSAAWYNGYPKSAFHTFNDVGEWEQMDKLGHAWTAYTTSRITTGIWEWAGMPHTGSVIIASGSA